MIVNSSSSEEEIRSITFDIVGARKQRTKSAEVTGSLGKGREDTKLKREKWRVKNREIEREDF